MTDDNKTSYFRLPSGEMVPNHVEDTDTVFILPEAIRVKIDAWVLRYPPERKASGVFEALRLVQEYNHGHLTVPLMDAVAKHLNMAKVAVYEVAAFYTMYHLKPVGRHIINICTNISCMLNGSEKLLEHVKSQLSIDVNETTADSQFTLKEVECLGACIAPPVCLINKKYHENMTTEKMDQILSELQSDARNG